MGHEYLEKEKRWEQSDIIDGVVSFKLSSWRYFSDFILSKMLDYSTYVWRGHRNNNWLLEPTLDRILKKLPAHKRTRRYETHLESFTYAARGRRGNNPPPMTNENDWWALGQHNGLVTPLLDWTSSPFVAAFFAFNELGDNQTNYRRVYAVSRVQIERKSIEIAANHNNDKGRPPNVEFVRPFSDENPRLVNQAGLFSRAPANVDIEKWVRKHFRGETEIMYLIKIDIPDNDRVLALRSLNRMNINHLTLFPDMHGTCNFCNMDLVIDHY